jgi:hypothetical protein
MRGKGKEAMISACAERAEQGAGRIRGLALLRARAECPEVSSAAEAAIADELKAVERAAAMSEGLASGKDPFSISESMDRASSAAERASNADEACRMADKAAERAAKGAGRWMC